MYINAFGEKLKESRNIAGYTQQQVEDLTGIKRMNISRYERGEREPDLETLGKLADFYEVDVNWLLGTKGGKKND